MQEIYSGWDEKVVHPCRDSKQKDLSNLGSILFLLKRVCKVTGSDILYENNIYHWSKQFSRVQQACCREIKVKTYSSNDRRISL